MLLTFVTAKRRFERLAVFRFLKEERLRLTMSRARGWCFTLNHWTENEETSLRDLEVLYICVGKEIGKKGTPHLQGFLYYANPVRFATVASALERAHWEPLRGTPQQAAAYCQKDGDFWEVGEKPVKGARTDLVTVAEQVRSGASLSLVAAEHPGMFVRYSKGLTALKMTLMKDRTEMPAVAWLWGPSGSGKSRYAVDLGFSFYIKDGTQWWDGYDGQECIIIDDFDGKWPFRDFLRLLDRYPYQGQFKGGYVKIDSPLIYITCEFPPEEIWSGTELKQVLRRLSRIRFVPGTKVWHRG